jgi:tetratricopeptide (TPR) repeat protein
MSMPVYKCRMCGADLEVNEGDNVVECSYCRSTQAVPNVDDEKLLKLFARANKLLRACEFDKAAGVYEQIVAEDDASAEAYWGLFLCRYGIEYVDEPSGGKKPTLHRASFENVMDDEDLELACENADPTARRLYRDQAKEIERIRRRITEVSGAEEPYDIFICYKETDPATGGRTLDSVLAQDIYKALENEGYRAFFSRVTLEGKLGLDYEPYIFAALNSAKVMLVVGTDYDHFDAVWVKNEWARFLRLMEKNPSKHLIPCYKGIDAYDMPSEFARLQGQDLGKVGATQDLLHGIAKLIGSKASDSETQANSNRSNLTKRGYFFLEDGDFNRADEYFEKALDENPEDAKAYAGKILAGLHLSSLSEINNHFVSFDNDANFERAMKFSTDKDRKQLEAIKVFADKKVLMKRLCLCIEQCKNNEEKLERTRKSAYIAAGAKRLNAVYKSDFDEAIKAYEALGDYKDAKGKANACAEEWAQIEKHAKTICGCYVPPDKAIDTSESPVERLMALETLRDRFPSSKAALDDAEEKQDEIVKKRRSLEAERARLGIFRGARKREIASELERLEKEEASWERAKHAARANMGGYGSASQLEGEIAAARIEAEAMERREKEQREKREAARKNQAALKEALVDRRALLHAESLKKGVLDSMQDDPTVWPIVKSTAYLYHKTAQGKLMQLLSGKFPFGTWHGYPLQWRMLKKSNGRALLICSEVIEQKSFNALPKRKAWRHCDLRKWLNGEFFQTAFSTSEQRLIAATKLANTQNGINESQSDVYTADKVFCLSVEEAESLFYGNRDRICESSKYARNDFLHILEGEAAPWWLRTPGNEDSISAAAVNERGLIYKSVFPVSSSSVGVRPAIWVDLGL